MSRLDVVRLAGADFLRAGERARLGGSDAGAAEQEEIRYVMHNSFRSKPPDSVWQSAATELQFAARWARNGFPLIRPSGKLCASMATTSLPAASISELRPPWSDFAIQVPDSLLRHPHKDMPDVSWIAFTVLPSGWGIALGGSEAIGFMSVDRVAGAEDLASRYEGGAFPEDRPDMATVGGAFVQASERIATLARRILAGVCIEMQNRRSHTVREERVSSRRGADEPVRWTFRLTRDVRIDLRAEVRGYCLGETNRITVQSLVRGHWKNQPHGPGNSLRKWIHVEPFWRGPEDAPIAVRSHVIGGA